MLNSIPTRAFDTSPDYSSQLANSRKNSAPRPLGLLAALDDLDQLAECNRLSLVPTKDYPGWVWSAAERAQIILKDAFNKEPAVGSHFFHIVIGPADRRSLLAHELNCSVTNLSRHAMLFNDRLLSESEPLSHETFASLFVQYLAQFNQAAQQLIIETPQVKEVFSERLNHYLDGLEVEVDHASIERRVSRVNIAAADTIYMTLHQQNGLFRNPIEEIWIDPLQTAIDLELSTHHELLHAVSGRIMTTKKAVSGDDNLSWRRLGLRFGGERTDLQENSRQEDSQHLASTKTARLAWLDEALTEMIATKLIGHDSGIYAAERDLLGKFFTKVPSKLFLEAYFSDRHSNSDFSARALGRLFRSINEAFGSQFLINLDNYVRKFGTQRALDQF